MIIQDFNYALRLLAKKPGFTALTTLVMAVGIGISVYMFSFFNTIIYKDLPFQDGDSLMLISSSQNGQKKSNSINLVILRSCYLLWDMLSEYETIKIKLN